VVSPFPKLRSQAKIAVGEDHRPHRPCEIQEGTAFLARAPIDTPTGGHAGYVLEQSRKVLQHKLSENVSRLPSTGLPRLLYGSSGDRGCQTAPFVNPALVLYPILIVIRHQRTETFYYPEPIDQFPAIEPFKLV